MSESARDTQVVESLGPALSEAQEERRQVPAGSQPLLEQPTALLQTHGQYSSYMYKNSTAPADTGSIARTEREIRPAPSDQHEAGGSCGVGGSCGLSGSCEARGSCAEGASCEVVASCRVGGGCEVRVGGGAGWQLLGGRQLWGGRQL